MGASAPREAKPGRRPALWPYLVLPLVVLLIYCALYRVQHPRHPVGTPATATDPASTAPQQ